MLFLSNIFGHRQTKKPSSITTALDLVTWAAGLVSIPQDVDLSLDQVRMITSRLHPGENLNEADQKVLFAVYDDIEQYLTTREPLRRFTKEELRARIDPILRAQLEAYEASAE